MKKNIVILILIFLSACGAEESEESIKEKIQSHREELSEIENKIANLEHKLSEVGEKKETTKLLVTLETIKKKQFSHYVEVSANLEAVNSAFVSPEISGQIKTVHVIEGQFVRKGRLLVSLNADIIAASIKELNASYELAKLVYEKQSELWEKKIGSEIQYLQAKTNKESLEGKLNSLKLQQSKSKILAPFSGIVDEISLKKGELASPGMRIIQMVDINTFFVNADVSEKYIASLKKGDDLLVTFPSYENVKISAKVYRTGNVIKQANRTFELQVKINNIKNQLKPNMLATIKFQDFFVGDATTVPSILISEDLKGKFLFLAVEKDGKLLAQKTYISSSYSNSEETLITKGLKEGDKIITKGYNLVKNGMEISVN